MRVVARWLPSRFSNFSFLRSKIVVCCSNALRHTRKPPWSSVPASPVRQPTLRQAKRLRRASSAIGEFVAEERGGKFSASQSFENSENAERISLRESLIRFPCRAVPRQPGNGV